MDIEIGVICSHGDAESLGRKKIRNGFHGQQLQNEFSSDHILISGNFFLSGNILESIHVVL